MWGLMRFEVSAAIHIRGARFVKGQLAVRTPSNRRAVVMVLAVVLPPALSTDLVGPAFFQREMSATRTRVRAARSWGGDVAHPDVALEPRTTSRQDLVVAETWIVVRSAQHSRHSTILPHPPTSSKG